MLLGVFGLGRALTVLATELVGRNDKLDVIVPLHPVQPTNAAVLAVVAGCFLAA